jgi:hypothetical protein
VEEVKGIFIKIKKPELDAIDLIENPKTRADSGFLGYTVPFWKFVLW